MYACKSSGCGLVLLLLFGLSSSTSAQPGITALSYHDVSDGKPRIERAGITTDMLVSHLDWLHGNGYTPVSIQDLIDAKAGKRPLPERSAEERWRGWTFSRRRGKGR